MNTNRPDVQKKIDEQVKRSVDSTKGVNTMRGVGEIDMTSPDGSARIIMRNGYIAFRVGENSFVLNYDGGKLE